MAILLKYKSILLCRFLCCWCCCYCCRCVRIVRSIAELSHCCCAAHPALWSTRSPTVDHWQANKYSEPFCALLPMPYTTHSQHPTLYVISSYLVYFFCFFFSCLFCIRVAHKLPCISRLLFASNQTVMHPEACALAFDKHMRQRREKEKRNNNKKTK